MKNRVGFEKKTLRDVPLDGQVVLVRADYNVPLTADGAIDDDYRIRMSLPTIRALMERGCKVVVCAHLGRPDGKFDEKYSLAPVAQRLGELMDCRVTLAGDCVGDKAAVATRRQRPGEIILLENLRFHEEEEANDAAFAREIARASRARYFVQDGFGVVHRAHASTSAITEWLPSVSGLLLEREYLTITRAMRTPEHPLTAIVGGAKIADKIDVIEAFAKIADKIVIGGAMANTFLKYQGKPVGASLVEDGLDDIVQRALEAGGAKLVLPRDVAVAREVTPDAERRDISLDDVRADDHILDVGAETIESVSRLITTSRTVVWNGTLGMAELPNFAHGSARVALALATNPGITSVIGGGDTADFALKWDGRGGESFTHVSTGGGASLELMSGKELPGVLALLDA